MKQFNYIGRISYKSRHIMLLVITIIMSSILLIPDLTFIGTETIIFALVFWSPTIIKMYTSLDRRSKTLIKTSVAYFVVVLIYKLLGFSIATWDIAAGYFGWTTSIIISTFSIQIFPDRNLRIIEFSVFLVILLSIIYVTILGIMNLTIMDVEEAISQENAAYSSLIMLFSGICFIAILRYDNMWLRLIYIIGLILSINVNFMILQRGTNVIFTVIMLFLIIYFNKSNLNNIKFKSFLLISISFILYYSGILISILDYAIEIFPSERVASRLSSIVTYIETKDAIEAGTSFTTRTELAEQSLNTFFSSISNMVIGIGDNRGFSSKIGNHSEIIDSLARYGIVGFSILVSAFYAQYKYLKNIIVYDISLRYQILTIYLMYFMRNINGNTMTPAVALLLFLYLPIVVYFTKKRRKI